MTEQILATLPPGLILIAGALLLPLIKGPGRKVLLLGIPLCALAQVLALDEGTLLQFSYLGQTVVPLRVDPLARLFGIIFSLMAFLGALFALRQERVVELSAAFLYAGSALGVVFAGDLLTVFVFWEMMAIGSGLIIWSTRTKESYGAAMRYLLVHFFGGVVLMVGVVWHMADTGTIAFDFIGLSSPATWFILAGFLINAGAPPLSAWVGDAYPEASFSGMVFLSAFTTKTAVYVLLRGYPGTELLIYVGLYMVFYGIVYALLENDMRRILAYSIVNQVGFMVTGIGIGSDMALNGAAAHAFAHILYKALLLMAAGAVLYQTGKRKCTDLGGLFQSMPLTTVCGIIGALSISAFPWTSGFVTKSMINDAAAYAHLGIAWFLLTAASAGVFLHAGIKFPWFVFFQRDSGLRPRDPPWSMRIAMVLAAALCIGIGVYPDPLYAFLPRPVEYVPYTVPHVMKMLQLLLFSGLAFFLLLPLMKRTLTISLDFDWIYRKVVPSGVAIAEKAVSAAASGFAGGPGLRIRAGIEQTLLAVAGQGSPIIRTARTSHVVLVVTAALGAALVFSLFRFW